MNKLICCIFLFTSLIGKAQIQENISYEDSIVTRNYKNTFSFYASGKTFLYIENKIYKNKSERNSVLGNVHSVNVDSTERFLTNNTTIFVKLRANYGDSFQYIEVITKKNKSQKSYIYEVDTFSFEMPVKYLFTFLKIFW